MRFAARRVLRDGRKMLHAAHMLCWLARHADVNRLNNLMGHTSPEMLFRHYNKAVTRKRARGFWKIEPPATKSKIIAMAAA